MFVVHQLVDSDALAHHHIGLELNAHPAEIIHFALHDGLGQAKLRDAIDEHAAEFVQSFKDAHTMTLLDEVSGGR